MQASGGTSRKHVSLALLAMALCGHARADDDDAPVFSFSGFGTLGVVRSSEGQADFVTGFVKPHGAGYTRTWSAAVDSLLAAQVNVQPTPNLSAVLQVISQLNYDRTWRPHVEWANVAYQATPELSVRLGRTVLPVLLLTDTFHVGFANPWVRPPFEVYNLVDASTNDGLDVRLRWQAGASTHAIEATAGQTNTKFPNDPAGPGTSRTRDGLALAYSYEQGFASARLSGRRTRASTDAFRPLFDAFRQFGAEGAAIADRYDVHSSLVTFIGAGAVWDAGDWFAMGEWNMVSSRNPILGRKSGWYASAGWRFAAVTPYFVLARATADRRSEPGLAVSELPPFLAGSALGLNAALDTILAGKPVQKTVSVGVRWDFRNDIALKLQYDHTRLGAGSSGPLINLQPGYRRGGTLDLVSATMDFTF